MSTAQAKAAVAGKTPLPLTTNMMVRKTAASEDDAQHHAAEQGEGVDVVAIGVGLPQIEFGQAVGRQFGNEGDGGAGIEGDLEDVGLADRDAGRAGCRRRR